MTTRLTAGEIRSALERSAAVAMAESERRYLAETHRAAPWGLRGPEELPREGGWGFVFRQEWQDSGGKLHVFERRHLVPWQLLGAMTDEALLAALSEEDAAMYRRLMAARAAEEGAKCPG